jgi:hypothetical protein
MDGAQIGNWKERRIDELIQEKKHIDEKIIILYYEVQNGEE